MMVIHTHQLVDQITELSRVVDLVPALTTHRALLVFELLLQNRFKVCDELFIDGILLEMLLVVLNEF